MKVIIAVLAVLLLQVVPVYADSYIVMDGEDGTVYEGSNVDYQQSIASTSKIMTAIIAIEKGELYDTWVVQDEIQDSYGSMIYLQPGQTVNLVDLLYGLMLESGNDAADAIAYHIGGNNTAQFIAWMNEKAKEIGMEHTVFRNPSGLDEADGGNLSTVKDLAVLMSYAMKNDVFAQITQTKYYTTQDNAYYVNHNKLLWNFTYAVGGKTGFTQKAQKTLVTAANKDGVLLITVSFHMGDEVEFHKACYQRQYEHVQEYIMIPKGVYLVDGHVVTVAEDFTVHAWDDEIEMGEASYTIEEGDMRVTWKTPRRTVVQTFPIA